MRKKSMFYGPFVGLVLVTGFGVLGACSSDGNSVKPESSSGHRERQASAAVRPPVPRSVAGSQVTVALTDEEMRQVVAADRQADPGQRLARLQRVAADVVNARLRADSSLTAAALWPVQQALVWDRLSGADRAAGSDALRAALASLKPTAADRELDRREERAVKP
jgi:hypothetical protein